MEEKKGKQGKRKERKSTSLLSAGVIIG